MRLIVQVQHLEQLAGHLFCDLYRVTSVHENHRPVLQDNDHTRGPGKSADPAQPLVAFGNILAQVLVGTRDDQGIQPQAGQVLANPGQPLGYVSHGVILRHRMRKRGPGPFVVDRQSGIDWPTTITNRIREIDAMGWTSLNTSLSGHGKNR